MAATKRKKGKAKKKTMKRTVGKKREIDPLGERSPYMQNKRAQELAAKQRIAQYIASEYVKDFDAVLLDTGSTAEEIAKEMFRTHNFLTVLTNGMGAYMAYTKALSSVESTSRIANELLLTGGRYDSLYEALHGDAALQAIDAFSPNVTIVTVSGVRDPEGVFCHGSEEVRIKGLICKKKTDTRVIAAHWKKLGRRDAYAFQPDLAELTKGADKVVLVTTRPSGGGEERREFDEEVAKIERAGIEVQPIKIQ